MSLAGSLQAAVGAVVASPGSPMLLRDLSDRLSVVDDTIPDIAGLRSALVTARPSADAAFEVALTARASGDEALAIPVLEAALATGEDARLWQMLGLCQRALDRRDLALPALLRAAEMQPTDARIAHGHARCALEAGLPAVELFDRASRLAPNDGDILMGRMAALAAGGQASDAVDALTQLVAVHPGWLAGHAQLAQLRYARGEETSFVSELETAIASAPRDARLWLELVAIHMRAEQFGAALGAIARGRAAAGEQLGFAANAAVCLSETGDTKAADAAFKALPAIEDVPFTAWRLRHLLRMGRSDLAARVGEALIDRTDTRLIWPYLGLAWRQLGDPRALWLSGTRESVAIVDLAARVPDMAQLATLLRKLHRSQAQPFDQSVRGGTQTDGPLLARIEPELMELRAVLVDTIRAYIDDLPDSDPAHPMLGVPRRQIRFAGSWSVRLTGAGHHVPHVHPAGWISSALYIALPDGSPPPTGWLRLGVPPPGLGAADDAITIEPKPGRLVLFPSHWWHGTVPFDAGERLSVAFDIARPRG